MDETYGFVMDHFNATSKYDSFAKAADFDAEIYIVKCGREFLVQTSNFIIHAPTS